MNLILLLCLLLSLPPLMLSSLPLFSWFPSSTHEWRLQKIMCCFSPQRIWQGWQRWQHHFCQFGKLLIDTVPPLLLPSLLPFWLHSWILSWQSKVVIVYSSFVFHSTVLLEWITLAAARSSLTTASLPPSSSYSYSYSYSLALDVGENDTTTAILFV